MYFVLMDQTRTGPPGRPAVCTASLPTVRSGAKAGHKNQSAEIRTQLTSFCEQTSEFQSAAGRQILAQIDDCHTGLQKCLWTTNMAAGY